MFPSNQAVLSRDEDIAQWKSDEELFGWIRKNFQLLLSAT
jgi:hypothetical protein